MKVYKGDKCGRECDIPIVVTVRRDEKIYTDVNSGCEYSMPQMNQECELCEACYNDFVDWFKKRE